MSQQPPLRQAVEEFLEQFGIKPTPQREEEEQKPYANLMDKTQDRIDELNEKAQELLQKSGMTREELEAYAINPNNFTREQWEALQKLRETLDTMRRQVRVTFGEQVVQKVEKRAEKKQEQRFGKKKHWIPL